MTATSRANRAGRVRGLVLGGLVLLLVLALAVLAVAFTQRTSGADGSLTERAGALVSGEDPTQAEREVVMSQARQFMLRINTYGPDLLAEDGTMPDYRAGVEEVISPKFTASFEQGVVAAEQTVSAAGLARTTEVFATGVSSLDADSARVLVAGSFVNSYPAATGRGARESERIEDEPAPFRVEVALVRTGGEWLVDDFVPVTGETTEAPRPVPSEVPVSSGDGGGGR